MVSLTRYFLQFFKGQLPAPVLVNLSDTSSDSSPPTPLQWYFPVLGKFSDQPMNLSKAQLAILVFVNHFEKSPHELILWDTSRLIMIKFIKVRHNLVLLLFRFLGEHLGQHGLELVPGHLIHIIMLHVCNHVTHLVNDSADIFVTASTREVLYLYRRRHRQAQGQRKGLQN